MAEELTIKSSGVLVPRMSGVLWGPAKGGKTSLLMTSPGKKLLVNVDPDGYTSISHRDDYSLIDLVPYEPSEIIGLATKKLPTMIRDSDFGPGDTLLVDSLSSFGYNALLVAIQNKVGEGRGFTPTIEAPGLAAYGARTQYILQLVRNCLKVTAQKGMHCWFTAHMDTPVTNDQGQFLYQSMTLSDNATNQTGLAVSEIWFLDGNDRKRTLAVRPCRGRKPMGSRMFRQDGDPEFELKFDINKPDTQPHSVSTWFNTWLENGRKKLELPK